MTTDGLQGGDPQNGAANSIVDVWPQVIGNVVDVYGRGRALLIARCCERALSPDDERQLQGWKRNLDGAVKDLLALLDANITDAGAGFKALAGVSAVNERLLEFIPVAAFSQSGSNVVGEAVLPRGFDSMIFADVIGPGPVLPPPGGEGLPPDKVLPFLEELERLLQEAVNRARQTDVPEDVLKKLQDILKVISGWLAAVRNGARVPLSAIRQLILWLIRSLARLGPAFIRLVGAVGAAVNAFLESIGTALGAEAGVAALAGAGFILAVVAAFAIGCGIGYVIGKQKVVGDTTVDDLIADALYIRFFAAPDDCEDLWEAYIRARAWRVEYENSGPTVDKAIAGPLLAREVSLLDKYIKNKCDPDHTSTLQRELQRQSQRLKFLLP